ncbi:MAG: hypothetical protein V1710_00540, partial [Candidatus Bathyarchaeota archaeon]
ANRFRRSSHSITMTGSFKALQRMTGHQFAEGEYDKAVLAVGSTEYHGSISHMAQIHWSQLISHRR